MSAKIAAKAARAPMTIPAMAPPEVFFAFVFIDEALLDELPSEELIVWDPDVEDDCFAPDDVVDLVGHPRTGLFVAHPSIGCAYPCAPVVLGAQISR
jgi:hypothetical protein